MAATPIDPLDVRVLEALYNEVDYDGYNAPGLAYVRVALEMAVEGHLTMAYNAAKAAAKESANWQPLHDYIKRLYVQRHGEPPTPTEPCK